MKTLHDSCAKKAPKKLEMSGRNEFIDSCVAEAHVKAGLAAAPKKTAAKTATAKPAAK